MKHFGELLKELRGKRSLRSVAEETQLSHTYISDLEKGYRRSSGTPLHPSVDTIKRLSKAYDYPYKDLMRAAGYLDEEDKEEIEERYSLNELPEQERVFFKDWEKYTKEEIEEAREWIEFKRQQRKKNDDR